MNSKTTLHRVFHAVAGAGPLLFLAIAALEGSARTDYDWIAQPISALALGERGWVQTVNFALLGVAFVSFAMVLRNAFRHGKASVAAPALFVWMTIGVVVAGAFPMDAAQAPPTPEGRLHGVGGFMVFPSIPLVVLLLARRFRREPDWSPYFRSTLATGCFCVVMLIFFLVFVGPPTSAPRAASEFRGLVQRVWLLPFFVWMALVARRAWMTGGWARASAHHASLESPSGSA